MTETGELAGMIDEVKKVLGGAVRAKRASGLLLSGGLDSAILARLDPKVRAITVALENLGEDLAYARAVAELLNMTLEYRSVAVEEAIEAIPQVIRVLKTFDPAIPNDITVYFGLRKARDLGLESVMTGDGSDELFAGYSFMNEIADLEGYIKRLSGSMRFSSNRIGDALGIEIVQPFLDKDVVHCALQIPVKDKIREREGKARGKWVLRKAFENTLPNHVLWQDKRPLEQGSGMTGLREIISRKISAQEFSENPYGITFMSREHMYYYKVYRDLFGEVPRAKEGEKACPWCGGALGGDSRHCYVCGWAQPL